MYDHTPDSMAFSALHSTPGTIALLIPRLNIVRMVWGEIIDAMGGFQEIDDWHSFRYLRIKGLELYFVTRLLDLYGLGITGFIDYGGWNDRVHAEILLTVAENRMYNARVKDGILRKIYNETN